MTTHRVTATQLAGKVEGTEGTKIACNNTDMMLTKNCTFSPSIEQYPRELLRGTLSRDPALSGKRSANISFDCEMYGSGNKGVAPPWGRYVLGCGFNETVSANNSVTYTPLTSNMTNSMTLEIYQDGMIKRMWGSRGTFSLIAEAGKPGILHFAFEGCDFEVVDGALLTPTYSAIVPPVLLTAALLLDSYAIICGKIDLALDNTLVKRESMNSTSGYLSTLITGRNPKGSADPEQTTVASYDFYGKWKTPGTIGALSLAATGATGNIITISCPKVRYAAIADQDRTGLRTLGLDFQACVNSADDEISIVLT